MTTNELDRALMVQYTIESISNDIKVPFKLEESYDDRLVGFQIQAPEYCLKSKGFLCSNYIPIQTPEGEFSKAMKDYMVLFESEIENKQNEFMKSLRDPSIKTLCQQIGMMAMHAQLKDTNDIFNIEHSILSRSLDPESVSVSIALYVYYTILVNANIGPQHYNELFFKCWYQYYYHWQVRIIMFRSTGNKWKSEFDGVLLN